MKTDKARNKSGMAQLKRGQKAVIKGTMSQAEFQSMLPEWVGIIIKEVDEVTEKRSAELTARTAMNILDNICCIITDSNDPDILKMDKIKAELKKYTRPALQK